MGEQFSLQTRLLHNQHKIDPHTGAVSVPIQHASTFHQFSFGEFGEYDYARSGNPTRQALEEVIAELEGGVRGFAFASGMAAISTAFLLFEKGDHVLVTEDVYGGTFRVVTQILPKFGIDYTFVDMTNLEEVREAIQENTKMLYIETPSNPTMKVSDIRGLVALAKDHGCLTFLDNTFMTPILQRPLDLGVDLVVHSATKFLGGHSDVIAGLAVAREESLAKEIGFLQNAFGSVLGVQDCWLLMRGMKTLHVRMQQSAQSAQKIAEWLATVPEVKNVYYPGLKTHPHHQLQQEQATSFGAVLSFELADKEAVKAVVEQVKVPVFAVSLGAVESILSYPATMSHAAMPKEEREQRGITDGLLRLSVGLENADELLADLQQAFESIS